MENTTKGEEILARFTPLNEDCEVELLALPLGENLQITRDGKQLERVGIIDRVIDSSTEDLGLVGAISAIKTSIPKFKTYLENTDTIRSVAIVCNMPQEFDEYGTVFKAILQLLLTEKKIWKDLDRVYVFIEHEGKILTESITFIED